MTAVYQRPNSGMIVANDYEYGQVDAARQSSYNVKLNTVIIYIIYQDSASNNKSKKSHFDSQNKPTRFHFWSFLVLQWHCNIENDQPSKPIQFCV